MRSLNHRQIEAFRAVMLSGSMTSAGRILHISQPAVTRLVRDLEEELDLILFSRRWSGVRPTAEAVALFREVERYFDSMERVRDRARLLKEKQGGQLRIAAMSTLSAGALPSAIKRFKARHPEISFFIHSDHSVHILDSLQRDEFALGFGRVPVERTDVDHIEMPLSSAICLIPRDNPLHRKEAIHARDLDGESFISLGVSSLLRMQIEDVMQSVGARTGAIIQTLYSNTAPSYVSAGLGVSVTDIFSVMNMDLTNVAVRPFLPDIPFRFSAIFPSLDHAPHSQAFAQVFQEIIEEHVFDITRLFTV